MNETVEEVARVKVKFAHPHGEHQVGDVAEFDEPEARRLVRGGVAQVESGEIREAPAPAEEQPAQPEQPRTPRRTARDSGEASGTE